MVNPTNIAEILTLRMEVAGWTQAKLAEAAGCTPNQMGQFLKGKSSLNRVAIDKCFDALGIHLDAIANRIDLAKKVAKKLSSSSIDDISAMSRKDMIAKTGLRSLRALPVVTKEEFEIMMESRIGDYEATFQYFKTLVLHFKQTSTRITPKTVDDSLSLLAKSLLGVAALPMFGIASIVTAGLVALTAKNVGFTKTLNNAWGALTTITDSIFDKENKETK